MVSRFQRLHLHTCRVGRYAYEAVAVKLNTRVFELYRGKYRNLLELARAMGISGSQLYRVKQGKRSINEKFIIGAIEAFPGYSLDDLFYHD